MEFLWSRFQAKISLVLSIEMTHLFDSDHEGFLVYIVDLSQDKRHISDIQVVCGFSYVLSKEILGFSLEREVEFNIEFIPGTEPISRASYRLDPVELKELKEKYRICGLYRCFISRSRLCLDATCPSISLWFSSFITACVYIS